MRWEERLRSGFAQPEEQGRRAYLTVVSSCLKEGCREDRTGLFSEVLSKRTGAIVTIRSEGNPD